MVVGESVSDVRRKIEEDRLEKELKVQKLNENISELERVIQERKSRRASLVDKTLARTSVLGAELERLRLLPDDEHKSKFVCSLTYGHKNIRQSEKTFKLADVLSNRQAEFEREQESQAFFIAQLRGQQVNARSSLRDFRRDFRDAETSGRDTEEEKGEEEEEEGNDRQGAKVSSVLRKVEKKWVGDNFRLRCLRSELQAFRSTLSRSRGEEEKASEKEEKPSAQNPALTLEDLDKGNLYLVSSILTEVVESSLEEAQKREALLALRDGGSHAMDSNAFIHNVGRTITNEILLEVVRYLAEETCREIQFSYEEARRFASQLVSSALTNEEHLKQSKEFEQRGEGSSSSSSSSSSAKGRLNSRKARKCLSSVLNGMSEHFEAHKLFCGNPLFRDFTSGVSYGEGCRPKQMKMNLEPKHQRESDSFKDREEDFWSNVQLEPSQTKVEPTSKKSQLSCIQTSDDGKHLAAGSFSGELFVWNLQSNAQPALYSAPPKRKGKSKNGVLSLCWSKNHLQVCALFEDGSLSVHKLKEPKPEQDKDKDKDKADSDEDDDDDGDQIAFLSAPQVCKSSDALETSHSNYAERLKVHFSFHPSITTAGLCPRFVVPNICGDVTMITMDQGGGPGDLYRAIPRGRRQPPGEQTKDFLSRPLKPCRAGIKQVLCHGHSEPVIFAGYSEKNSNLVTVDTAGEISIWSCSDSKRTDFGWYVPDQTWKTNLSVSTLTALETYIPVDLEEEGQADATDLEVANMKRWLTSYKYVGSKKNMTTEYQIIHVPKGIAKGKVTAYLSSYSLPGKSLKERTKVKASWVKNVPSEVCAASFTSLNQELILFTKATTSEEDRVVDHFSIFVVCLKSGVLKTPRIDVPIAEEDGPPAFAVSKTIPLLGSDYLYVGIGCNHVGVFSLATGFMVKDIEIVLPSSVSILELNLVDSTYTGVKDMLCCRCFSPSEKVKMYFFDISDQVALEACLEQRDPRQVKRDADDPEESPLEEEEGEKGEEEGEEDQDDVDQEQDVDEDESEQEDNEEEGEESEEESEEEEEDTE